MFAGQQTNARGIYLYFLFITRRVVKRKYTADLVDERQCSALLLGESKCRQWFCLSCYQHRAKHHRHHPANRPGTSAVWKYKAIYSLHDEQFGQWSDVVSVTVGG